MKQRLIVRLYEKQKGICPWCGFTMILEPGVVKCTGVTATLDHLVPKTPDSRGIERPAVAAHRICNNARGHNLKIRDHIIAEIAKCAAKYGLTKNSAVANLIHSQMIYPVHPETCSPFSKVCSTLQL